MPQLPLLFLPCYFPRVDSACKHLLERWRRVPPTAAAAARRATGGSACFRLRRRPAAVVSLATVQARSAHQGISGALINCVSPCPWLDWLRLRCVECRTKDEPQKLKRVPAVNSQKVNNRHRSHNYFSPIDKAALHVVGWASGWNPVPVSFSAHSRSLAFSLCCSHCSALSFHPHCQIKQSSAHRFASLACFAAVAAAATLDSDEPQLVLSTCDSFRRRQCPHVSSLERRSNKRGFSPRGRVR